MNFSTLYVTRIMASLGEEMFKVVCSVLGSVLSAAGLASAVTFGGLGNLKPDLETRTSIHLKVDKGAFPIGPIPFSNVRLGLAGDFEPLEPIRVIHDGYWRVKK